MKCFYQQTSCGVCVHRWLRCLQASAQIEEELLGGEQRRTLPEQSAEVRESRLIA